MAPACKSPGSDPNPDTLWLCAQLTLLWLYLLICKMGTLIPASARDYCEYSYWALNTVSSRVEAQWVRAAVVCYCYLNNKEGKEKREPRTANSLQIHLSFKTRTIFTYLKSSEWSFKLLIGPIIFKFPVRLRNLPELNRSSKRTLQCAPSLVISGQLTLWVPHIPTGHPRYLTQNTLLPGEAHVPYAFRRKRWPQGPTYSTRWD